MDADMIADIVSPIRVYINSQLFTFLEESEVKAHLYDLDIIEPYFDKSSEKFIGGGTSMPIVLPGFIEAQIRRCRGLEPCSRVYQDANGRKRLTAYFD